MIADCGKSSKPLPLPRVGPSVAARMEADVFDIGWRGMLLAVIVLTDAIVFADLVRAELRELRGNRHRSSARDLGTRRKLSLAWLRRRHAGAHSL